MINALGVCIRIVTSWLDGRVEPFQTPLNLGPHTGDQCAEAATHSLNSEGESLVTGEHTMNAIHSGKQLIKWADAYDVVNVPA